MQSARCGPSSGTREENKHEVGKQKKANLEENQKSFADYNWEAQPRPQCFSLKKWMAREKPHPFFEGKAQGTRLLGSYNVYEKNAKETES